MADLSKIMPNEETNESKRVIIYVSNFLNFIDNTKKFK